jgi:hypothetical protein
MVTILEPAEKGRSGNNLIIKVSLKNIVHIPTEKHKRLKYSASMPLLLKRKTIKWYNPTRRQTPTKKKSRANLIF